MVLMSRCLLILTLMLPAVLPTPAACAQDETRTAEIAAATERAVDGLRADIGATRIAPNLTVEDFLRRTGGSDKLRTALLRSPQIGGPRWIDDQTCQVKLEASGETVAATLVEIASANPQRSPLPPDVLAHELRGWKSRAFVATGTSMSPKRLNRLRPLRIGAWDQIDEGARREAVAMARVDAVRRALHDTRPIEISAGTTIGDALTTQGVADRMNDWFGARPIKAVAFSDDLEVDLTLSAPADETFDALISAIKQSGEMKLPDDPSEISRIRTEFVQRMARPEGRATAARPIDGGLPRAVELPFEPPDWVNHQIDAEGSTRSVGKPLVTQRVAQNRALDNLRAKVGGLPLGSGMTLNEAAKQDERISHALDRGLDRARVFKVDFDAEGGVLVRVTLDARDVWDEIANSR